VSSCWWLPRSVILPFSMTRISSAFSTVDRRWAMTRVVRFFISSSRAVCMWRSDSTSRAEVASSSMSIGAFFRMALAMATRCLCPPDNRIPLSPIKVSSPSGRFCMNSSAWAAFAAFRTSFSVFFCVP